MSIEASAPTLKDQLARFASVGVASTAAHFALFALFNAWWGQAQAANLVALTIATLGNTAANRAWTFGVSGRDGAATHHAQAFVLFLVTWGATSAALAALYLAWPAAPTLAGLAALAASTGLAMVVRFTVMRRWIFKAT